MQVKTKEFNEAAAGALQDEKIQANLLGLYGGFHQARLEASAATENWEELRDRGRAIKAHTLENLDIYLRMAEENVRKAGGHCFLRQRLRRSDSLCNRTRHLQRCKDCRQEQIHGLRRNGLE